MRIDPISLAAPIFVVACAALMLAACGPGTPKPDAKRLANLEHVCIVTRTSSPDQCGCIAQAVAVKNDEALENIVIARMKNDQRLLARLTSGMSKIEGEQFIKRYEAAGRDVFYHCGRRTG